MLATPDIQLLGMRQDAACAPVMGAARAAAALAGLEQPGALREMLLDERLTIRFWGTRGGIPRAGRNTERFGGNTLCVTAEFGKDRVFIFDAGSGMVNFGQALAESRRHHRFNLFVSKPHWDHVQGLPFFEPLRVNGNRIVMHGTGPGHCSLREAVDPRGKGPYFPALDADAASRLEVRELGEGDYEIDGVRVSAIRLNHPNPALGYRLTTPAGQSMAYITDNEVCGGGSIDRQRLVAFLKDVDVLIHDAAYFDIEYQSRVGSGHSAVSAVLKLASEARARRLYLFHHDPSHDDAAIARKELIARYYFDQSRAGIQCWAAREGAVVIL